MASNTIDPDIMEQAQKCAESNIVVGDVDDETAVFTSSGLIGDIAAAMQSIRDAERAEARRLDRCLSASDKRADENFTEAVYNAFDLATARAERDRLAAEVERLREAGSVLATCVFYATQNPAISDEARLILRQTQLAWDAALASVKGNTHAE